MSSCLITLGYETTSNALAFTSYLLAIHPEEQEKLYAEINQYYSDHPVSIIPQ